MSVSDQISTAQADSALTTGSKLLEMLAQILMSLSNKKKYVDPDEKAIKVILDHLKNGGGTKSQIVSAQDAQILAACMKANHVPFVQMQFMDENGELKASFITRDSDAQMMQRVKEQFLFEMGVGMNEMSPGDFINNNMNQDIRQSMNYTEAEVAVFRRTAAKYNIAFSVIANKDNPTNYDIMYLPRDSENVTKALLEMHHLLAGAKGKEYLTEVEENIQAKKAFEDKINPRAGETTYIVDSKDPNNFISVNTDGFTLHSIQQSEQKTRNGGKSVIFTDSNTVTHTSYERDKLMKYVDTLYQPVVLTAKEFTLVKGIGPNGEAVLPPKKEFLAAFEHLKEKLPQMENKYVSDVARKIEKSPQIYNVVNIPQSVIGRVYDFVVKNELQDDIAVSGDCISYTDKVKKVMDHVLESTIYKGLTGLEFEEAKIFYEGRGEVSLSKIPGEKQYLVDADNPAFVIQLSSQGFKVIKDGKSITEQSNAVPEYKTLLEEIIKTMGLPVALNKEEMESPEKLKHIKDRLPENLQTASAEYLKNIDKNKVVELYNSNGENVSRLDKRQQSAYEQHKKHVVVDKYVERTFAQKITDHEVGIKLNQKIIHTSEQRKVGMDV